MRPQIVVMLNGHAGCLKTTLSYLLAPYLNTGHISTSLLGPITSDRGDSDFLSLRDERYDRAFKLVGNYLTTGASVVVDGTFALRRWREQLYTIAAENGAEEIISLKCVCGNTDKLERRFEFRRERTETPDAAADSIAAYFGSVEEFEPLIKDRVPKSIRISQIKFDSCEYTIQVTDDSPAARRVATLLRTFCQQGLLDEPLFSLLEPHEKSILVSFEGVGGSGKTTQAKFLKRTLKEENNTRAELIPEFSNSVLGDWLRSCSDQQLKVQFGAGRAGEHFLVLADFLSKFPSGSRRSPVTILDGGMLSRLAHMKALPPGNLPDEIWERVLRMTHEIVELVTRPYPRQIHIYLDCSPEMAVRRLQNRGEDLGDQDRMFVQELYAVYQELKCQFPDTVTVEAADDKEVVAARVYNEVRSELGHEG